MPHPHNDYYTWGRAVSAEGARIGFISCNICGCALFLDPSAMVDVLDLHKSYHDSRQEHMD